MLDLGRADRKSRSLHRTFERMEQQKHELLARLSSWTEEQRHFRPDSNSWSALDVVDHLVRVEHESLAAIRSKMPDGVPVGVREKIGAHIVFAVMRSPIRLRVPSAVISVRPGKSPVQATIFLRWQELRNDMGVLLSGLSPEQLTSGFFHHPVSGAMTIHDALTFLSVHITHHRYQLDRLRKAARVSRTPR